MSIRKKTFIHLLIVIPSGFLFKYYSGPGRAWFNLYGAGVMYEIFWVLLFYFIFPKKDLINVIPVAVFLVTCLLEFLQLWHPPLLTGLRGTFLGSALLGTTFSRLDFPHYALGCVLARLTRLR